jgi:hypothetical protein
MATEIVKVRVRLCLPLEFVSNHGVSLPRNMLPELLLPLWQKHLRKAFCSLDKFETSRDWECGYSSYPRFILTHEDTDGRMDGGRTDGWTDGPMAYILAKCHLISHIQKDKTRIWFRKLFQHFISHIRVLSKRIECGYTVADKWTYMTNELIVALKVIKLTRSY